MEIVDNFFLQPSKARITLFRVLRFTWKQQSPTRHTLPTNRSFLKLNWQKTEISFVRAVKRLRVISTVEGEYRRHSGNREGGKRWLQEKEEEQEEAFSHEMEQCCRIHHNYKFTV